jgi:hypothetical protein
MHVVPSFLVPVLVIGINCHQASVKPGHRAVVRINVYSLGKNAPPIANPEPEPSGRNVPHLFEGKVAFKANLRLKPKLVSLEDSACTMRLT